MLMKTALLTAALLAASQSAIAHGGGHRGRVIDFEPSLSIAVGSLYRDGFRIVYDLGGRQHLAPVEYAPAPYVVVPPVRQVVHVIHDDRRHGGHRQGRHWRDEWRDDSRDRGHRGQWRSKHRWEERHDRD